MSAEAPPFIPPSETGQNSPRHLTYNRNFDTQKYQALSRIKSTSPEEYRQKRLQLDGEVVFNLGTLLGERFNAGISTRTDRVMGQEILGTHSDEPLLAVFERGRDFRFQNSSEHDRMRESAEVIGFQKIQETLTNPDTPVGTMMLSISPSGGEESDYKHNFYDIFTLTEADDERSVSVSRFSSVMKDYEYMTYASVFENGYSFKEERTDLPQDAYFLRNPIRIDPDITGLHTADELHKLLHKKHETMSHEDLTYIIQGCEPLFLAYISVVATRPWALDEGNKTFNAILNKADFLKEKAAMRGREVVLYEFDDELEVDEQIDKWGGQVVREVTTGCGLSAGASYEEESGFFGGDGAISDRRGPFSVLEFGVMTDRYGKLTFKCPYCTYENRRPFNQLIQFCQSGSCGRDVSC